MHKFTDDSGDEWVLVLNVAKLKALKAEGVDVGKLVGDTLAPLVEFINDPCRLTDAAWALCQKQAEGRKLSREAFEERVFGDTLGRLEDAMLAEIADFFRGEKREALRRGIEVTRLLRERARKEAEAQTPEQAAEAAWREMEKARNPSTSNGSATASPAASPSTPAPSP